MPDPTSSHTVRVNALQPDRVPIQTAANVLQTNGVVIFPARCLYGIAANALNPAAVEKVFHLKQRPADNPVLVLVKDRAMLNTLVKKVPPSAERLMNAFWPGNITLVLEAADHVSPRLTAGTGKIGVRLPGHPVARALVEALDFPITGTSANISGLPGCIEPSTLPGSLMAGADLILDAGRVLGGAGSTIVDLTQTPPRIIREGAVSEAEVFAALSL